MEAGSLQRGYGHLRYRWGQRVLGLDRSRCKTVVRPEHWLDCPRGHRESPRRLAVLEVSMEMVSHFAGDERITLIG